MFGLVPKEFRLPEDEWVAGLPGSVSGGGRQGLKREPNSNGFGGEGFRRDGFVDGSPRLPGLTTGDLNWSGPWNPEAADDAASADGIPINTTDVRYVSYFKHVRENIERIWHYPPQAGELHVQGFLSLQFSIQRDGKLRGYSLLRSSGYEILDNAAINAVVQAGPYHPLPKRFEKEVIVVRANFYYRLVNRGFLRLR